MTEFPVDMIGIVKTMFLRSLGNPNAHKYITNHIMLAYFDIFFLIVIGICTIFIIKYVYKLFKRIKENHIKKEKTLIKKETKEIFSQGKGIFKILKYPGIGAILVGTSRLQVSVIFRLFNLSDKIITSNVTKETWLPQEGRVFGLSAGYTLLFFIIAGCFIGLSFGNKMLRNIGILFYVLGIFFMIFVLFLDYGYISDGLGNLVI